jgi:hypothetical protein
VVVGDQERVGDGIEDLYLVPHVLDVGLARRLDLAQHAEAIAVEERGRGLRRLRDPGCHR